MPAVTLSALFTYGSRTELASTERESNAAVTPLENLMLIVDGSSGYGPLKEMLMTRRNQDIPSYK